MYRRTNVELSSALTPVCRCCARQFRVPLRAAVLALRAPCAPAAAAARPPPPRAFAARCLAAAPGEPPSPPPRREPPVRLPLRPARGVPPALAPAPPAPRSVPLAPPTPQPAPPRLAAPPGPPDDGSIRVNKCFADTVSRREADRLLREGRVCVNGVVVTVGARVRPGDELRLDGAVVAWEEAQPARVEAALEGSAVAPDAPLPSESRFSYLKYWKPRGVVCTCDAAVPGNLLASLGPAAAGRRLYSVGRLDKDSTGVLLLTNDGRVPNAVLRAATRHSKTYTVRTHIPPSREQIQRLAAGVVITTVAQRDGVTKPLTARTRPCVVERDYGAAGGCSLLFTLQEGRNRQIRRMLDAVGLNTITLHRISFMSIGLDGLKPGEIAPLSEEEMRDIRRAVRAAAASGQDGAAGWGNDYVEEPREARDSDGDED